jgi:triacylglycerol esterase/lipase EstA (alpha/beta hydrolase family)
MLARIQQVITLSLVFGAILAFVLAMRIGQPWLALAYPVVVIAAYAAVLAAEFVQLRRSYAEDDPLRPSMGELVKAWAIEILVAPRIFLWHQPFRNASEPDHWPPHARGRRGIVLVHGFFCNRGLWNPWLRRLRADGIPFVAVSLEPVFGPIERYCETIGSAVAAVERATGMAPVIVAHSMGGLAVRAWLAANVDARVHALVTIATPHAGTRLGGDPSARHLALLRHVRGRNVEQMRHGSEWLAELERRDATTKRTRVVCFWSHCDNIVFPTRTATLAGADNRHLGGTPHVAMVFHPAVIEATLKAVAAPT